MRAKLLRLRKARKRLRLTSDQVATRLGISQGYYSRLERGHVERLDVRLAIRIEAVLGIPVSSWIDGERAMLESLLGFKRAGASGVLTYFALRAAQALQERR